MSTPFVTPYEDAFFEQHPIDQKFCTKEEWEFGLSSNFFKQLQWLIANQIYEIRNNLEDPDSPPEDFQFQRGRSKATRDFFELVAQQSEEFLVDVAQESLDNLEEEGTEGTGDDSEQFDI